MYIYYQLEYLGNLNCSTELTKFAVLFLRYLCYNITLNIPTCFNSLGIIIREPNQGNTDETKLATFIHS